MNVKVIFIRLGSQGVTREPDVSLVIVTNRRRDLLCGDMLNINGFPEFALKSALSEVVRVDA